MKPLLDLIWLLLLAATAFQAWLSTHAPAGPLGLPLVALAFGLAWLKGLGVILEFMELRQAPPAWRRALVGGITAITLLILVAYALAA
ncbi:cytochrome C oxidase subunit IV family protein [Ottowia sp.]|uniref:cytochrome C oxidase subunit IV family protein n=1 Tax=Ottowia sp. TaxID=1898956 RepID=UPI002B64B4DC|nr:cytochrome C oxidase subunit IV family protein [Ottowia sp.]HOB67124.1 cytochrome C oxidase subunit IV family protein [Ottowia sp.]HPZ56660.1 cytochrome C oxidase subunit IV family protein [Ottowia sp.]HQD47125.1 cytochrome C oxidase subunit IV family protein [Ottowia sp.]